MVWERLGCYGSWHIFSSYWRQQKNVKEGLSIVSIFSARVEKKVEFYCYLFKFVPRCNNNYEGKFVENDVRRIGNSWSWYPNYHFRGGKLILLLWKLIYSMKNFKRKKFDEETRSEFSATFFLFVLLNLLCCFQ